MPRLSWFLQPLLRSLQQFRAWKKLSTVLKPVASNRSVLRKLYWVVWWPLKCGCGFMLVRSYASVASLAMMFEDQFLTCDYICFIIQVFFDHVWADCYLNKIRQCVRKKNICSFFFYSTICKQIFAKCSFLFWWLGNGAEMYLLEASDVLPERRDPTV